MKKAFISSVIVIILVFFLFGVYVGFHFKPGIEIIKTKKVSWGDIRACIVNKGTHTRNVEVELRLWNKGVLVYAFDQEVSLFPFQRKTVVFYLPNILSDYDKYEIRIKQPNH